VINIPFGFQDISAIYNNNFILQQLRSKAERKGKDVPSKRSFNGFNDFEDLILNLNGLHAQEIYKIIFVSHYFPNFLLFIEIKGNFKVTIIQIKMINLKNISKNYFIIKMSVFDLKNL